MDRPYRLDECTWSELDRPLLVVPVGSCEQHGPHLPLGTDTLIATAIAEAAAAERPGVVLAPPLTVTASGEHQGFPGTLSIGTTVTEELVVELGRSADWSAGIVLVNGHGGNQRPVTAAVDRLTAEGRTAVAWWPTVPGGAAGDLHAGRVETSVMLAIAPYLVGELPEDVAEWIGVGPAPIDVVRLRLEGVRAVSPTGVLGDPSGATALEGHTLLTAWSAELLATIDHVTRDRAADR